jgi:hypothetical protein
MALEVGPKLVVGLGFQVWGQKPQALQTPKNCKRTNFYCMLSKNFSNSIFGMILQSEEKIQIKKLQLSSANQITPF